MEMIGITERDRKKLRERKWEVIATKDQNLTKGQKSYYLLFRHYQ